MATLRASPEDAGQRLDRFLARRMPETSRARVQEWIRAGRVQVDNETAKPSLRLRGGERVEVEGEPPPRPLACAFAEDIPLDVLYEDNDLAAIHKPAGMTVHAGGGAAAGTLVNALVHRFGRLSGVGGAARPGIVHRLDRLTSGVLLVAKNDAAHRRLARQFARRQVGKLYLALVHGRDPATRGRGVILEGTPWRRIELPISRDRRRRGRMTARAREGREAVTDFRVLRQWPRLALLEVRIATGRTHQIRVHLAAVGHPVVGDTLYGAPAQPAMDRVFLHAREISFVHPGTGQPLRASAPLPEELERHLTELEAGRTKLALL